MIFLEEVFVWFLIKIKIVHQRSFMAIFTLDNGVLEKVCSSRDEQISKGSIIS